MMMKNPNIFFVITAGVLLKSSCSLSEPHPVEQARESLIRERMMHFRLGSIRVRGCVISDQKEKMDGVSIKVLMGTMTGPLEERKLIDNVFDFSYENINGMHLTFSKDGYFSEEVALVPEQKNDKYLTIRLIEVGKPVQLTEYSGFLSFSFVDKSDVLCLNTEKAEWKSAQLIGGEVQKKDFALRGVYLTSEREESNVHILSSKKVTSVPKEVRINMLCDSDGFILCDSDEENTRSAFREMRIAPETGYKKSVILTPANSTIYFFCKIGDRYGKGYVDPVNKIRKDASIRTPFRLLMQKHQSDDRNVTGE